MKIYNGFKHTYLTHFKNALKTILIVFLVLSWMNVSPLRAQENQISDSKITRAIEAKLLVDDIVPLDGINVSTENGIVMLSGWVKHILSKTRATELAETIKGVRSVINTIEVRPALRRDEEIQKNIVQALAFDPAADSYEVEVSVQNGIVTLSGSVQSWQERQLCSKIARSVIGVTGVENKIAVNIDTLRTDFEIKQDIQRKLEFDVWVDASSIDVAVEDGNVVLSGAVTSAAEKSRAFTASWVMGVKSVDDEGLEVKWWLKNQKERLSRIAIKPDAEIKEALEDAFLYDPRMVSSNVVVYVENGVVTLTGVVNSLRAKQAASEDARNTGGVKRVKNYLKVRLLDIREDDQIAGNIEKAFLWDPIVEPYELSVSVEGGVVYLYGSVDSELEKSHAETVVARVDGVVDIKNYLRVPKKPLVDKMDWEIEQDIRNGLFWNPRINSNEITVEVNEGVAMLTGEVGSRLEYRIAEDEAYEGGARKVDNNLVIITDFNKTMPQ